METDRCPEEGPQDNMGKFMGQVDTKENWRVARLYLQKYTKEEKETIDDYVLRLKLQGLKCKFER